MRSKRTLLIGVALLAILAWWLLRGDRNLTQAKALQQELFSSSLPQEQRQQKWAELRAVSEKLKPEQRRELRREATRRFEQRMIAYAKKSPQERRKELDEFLAREQQRQREQQTRGNGPGNAAFGVGPAGGQGGANMQRQQRSAEDRDRARKQRIDNSSPEGRAARDIFFRDLQNRRRELGLPDRGPGRRGFAM